jgi:hypothetical protein
MVAVDKDISKYTLLDTEWNQIKEIKDLLEVLNLCKFIILLY